MKKSVCTTKVVPFIDFDCWAINAEVLELIEWEFAQWSKSINEAV